MSKDFKDFYRELNNSGQYREIMMKHADENGTIENSIAVSTLISFDLLEAYHNWLNAED